MAEGNTLEHNEENSDCVVSALGLGHLVNCRLLALGDGFGCELPLLSL